MRVSKLSNWLSLVIVLLAFLLLTVPGQIWGDEHPWDENDMPGGQSDPSSQNGGAVDPNAGTTDPGDSEFNLLGTPLFWWELYIGGDDTGIGSVQPQSENTSENQGVLNPQGVLK